MSLQQFFPAFQPSARQQVYECFSVMLVLELNEWLSDAMNHKVLSLWRQTIQLRALNGWGLKEQDVVNKWLWRELTLWRALTVINQNLSLVR